ncbi:MAG: hypothetical protein WAK82_06235, partial [Streptosporangiaceae bacterium]
MSDPRIAAALRAGSPGALAELFDAYGDRLFQYCWCMLRNREIAQIALRDTLVVAQGHITRLSDPRSLGPWLYSLARTECRRRRPVAAADADETPARPSQPDADSRLIAWNAVMSMDADQLEALDLFCRHDVDLGLVLGLTADSARALVDQARQELERALGAEILVSRGSHACPDRAEVMAGWTGVMTPVIRDRVLRHAAGCPVCGPKRPRNVSAARVFALLPSPALPSATRDEVLDFAENESHAAYREFAVSRTAALASSGFPVIDAPAAKDAAQEPEPATQKPEAANQRPEAAEQGPSTSEHVTPETEAAEPASLEPTAPALASELLAVPEFSTPAERLAAAAALLPAVDVLATPAPEPASRAPEPAGPASPPKDPAEPASSAPDPAGPKAPAPMPAVPAQPSGPALETLPRPAATTPAPAVTTPPPTTPAPVTPAPATPAPAATTPSPLPP